MKKKEPEVENDVENGSDTEASFNNSFDEKPK